MKKRTVKSNNRLVTKKKRRRNMDPVARQLMKQIFGGMAIFATIMLLLTGVWYGTRVSTLSLETITVEGGQTISHSQVSEAVANTLSGSYFGLIPKRFAWTYSDSAAMAAAANISRVKNPKVERVSGTELRVSVEEYFPFALWCKDLESQTCFFIDKEGVAFAQAPVLDGGSMYRFYTLDDIPEINKIIKDKATLNEIIKLADALDTDEFNLAVSKIEIDLVGDVFFHVVAGGEIKATTDHSAEKIIENLRIVLTADEFKNLQGGNFQYIDLRFGNKIFVNDVVTEVASSSEVFVERGNVILEENVDILETVMEQVSRMVNETEE